MNQRESRQDGPRADHPRNRYIVGYASPLSGSAGDKIDFKVSAKANFTVEYVRLRSNDDGAGEGCIVFYEDNHYGSSNNPCPGKMQDINKDQWKDGCGWDTSFCLTIPKNWETGIYAARCTLANE